MAHDWYRLSSWTEEDQKGFFARLHRSRSTFSKAQYATIQALNLHEIGTKESSRWALDLLDLVETEWPEPIVLASIHLQKADCYLTLDDLPSAINSYRAALAQEKVYPQVQTSARFDFPLLIASRKLVDLYEEALATLDLIDDLWLPTSIYQFNAATALITAEVGDKAKASERAETALLAMKQDHSGVSRHPKFGLVADVDQNIVRRLEVIAASG